MKKDLTDTAHKASFRQQQHQIDMLVTIINEFTEESTALAKAIEHILRRLDNIEKFLDQISHEIEKDHDVNRIVNQRIVEESGFGFSTAF